MALRKIDSQISFLVKYRQNQISAICRSKELYEIYASVYLSHL